MLLWSLKTNWIGWKILPKYKLKNRSHSIEKLWKSRKINNWLKLSKESRKC
jgi:hypothetical protein